MTATQLDDDALALDLARECVYRFLAAALSDPWSGNWPLLFDEKSQRLVQDASNLLRQEAAPATIPGLGELPIAEFQLQRLFEALPRSASELRGEYDRIFGLVLCRECPPYETEYHPAAETFLRAQQLADIAGFYRAFGLEPSRARPERPDHIALELEFIAFLMMKTREARAGAAANPEKLEQARICAEAQRKFFRDHLAWWLPFFTTGLRHKADRAFYAEVGRALAAFLPLERSRLDVAAPRMPLQPSLIERPEEQGGCAGCTANG
jgi:TorA maturation chaperone TorD